jgi:hypothetical protein
VGDNNHVVVLLFFLKNSLAKRKCETVHCHDATASSFVAKVQSKAFVHFHAVAVKHHKSVQNLLFGLPDKFFMISSLDIK